MATARAPASRRFRGSIAEPGRWLSTLRWGGRPPTTPDALPVAGRACPGGVGGWLPAGSRRKVSGMLPTSLPPFPGLPDATPVRHVAEAPPPSHNPSLAPAVVRAYLPEAGRQHHSPPVPVTPQGDRVAVVPLSGLRCARQHDMGDGLAALLLASTDAHPVGLEAEAMAVVLPQAGELLGAAPPPAVGVEAGIRLGPVLVQQRFVISLNRLPSTRPLRGAVRTPTPDRQAGRQQTTGPRPPPVHDALRARISSGSCCPG
jgi:hypothetical protein